MLKKTLPALFILSLVTLGGSVGMSSDAIAAPKKKEASGGGGGRKKFLSQEGRTVKGSSKTNIDFDAAAIDGERRIPAGIAIGGAKQDNEYDLINLRYHWRPEMVTSTSNLETGKGK